MKRRITTSTPTARHGAPDGDLEPGLAALVETFRGGPPLDSGLVDRLTAAAINEVSRPAASPAQQGRLGLRRRVLAVASSLAMVFSLGTGMAIAADGAAPGSLLYGLDRAFDAVGIGRGGVPEHVEEVITLVESGDVPKGLEHAAQLMAELSSRPSDPGPSNALNEAAERMRSLREDAVAVSAGVDDLLDYLSEHIDAIDGEKVSELARLIGGPPSSVPGPPTEPPAPTPPAGPGS